MNTSHSGWYRSGSCSRQFFSYAGKDGQDGRKHNASTSQWRPTTQTVKTQCTERTSRNANVQLTSSAVERGNDVIRASQPAYRRLSADNRQTTQRAAAAADDDDLECVVASQCNYQHLRLPSWSMKQREAGKGRGARDPPRRQKLPLSTLRPHGTWRQHSGTANQLLPC